LLDDGKPNDLYGEIARRVDDRIAQIMECSDEEAQHPCVYAATRRAMWWRSRGYTSRKRIKDIVVTYMYGQDAAHQ
jgi:hypothetical protein